MKIDERDLVDDVASLVFDNVLTQKTMMVLIEGVLQTQGLTDIYKISIDMIKENLEEQSEKALKISRELTDLDVEV